MTNIAHARSIPGMLVILLFVVSSASAVPTFQVYIRGATARDIGADDPTWVTRDSTSDLILVGTYQPNTESLAYGTLVISVPQGQSGTITISNPATLLTTVRTTPFGGNPNSAADIDLLANVPGHDGFTTRQALPGRFNDSYPFQNDTPDFLLLDMGSFLDEGPIYDYETRTDTIPLIDQNGQEKTLGVSVEGFSSVHFDLYGYENKTQGDDAWRMNPCHHDAAFSRSLKPAGGAPVPGTVLLGAIGAGLAAWLRTRRML